MNEAACVSRYSPAELTGQRSPCSPIRSAVVVDELSGSCSPRDRLFDACTGARTAPACRRGLGRRSTPRADSRCSPRPRHLARVRAEQASSRSARSSRLRRRSLAPRRCIAHEFTTYESILGGVGLALAGSPSRARPRAQIRRGSGTPRDRPCRQLQAYSAGPVRMAPIDLPALVDELFLSWGRGARASASSRPPPCRDRADSGRCTCGGHPSSRTPSSHRRPPDHAPRPGRRSPGGIR